MARQMTRCHPLRELREASNLSLETAADAISKDLGRTITPDYVRDVLEDRGTGRYELIRAMARAYGRSMDEVAEAARKRD